MERIEDYIRDKEALNRKIAATRQCIKDCSDPSERMRQSERLRIMNGMLRDTLDNIERLRPPQEKRRKARKKVVGLEFHGAGGISFDLLERTKACFSDLEGTRWDQLEETGLTANEAGALQNVLRRAYEGLTEKQRLYFTEKAFNGLADRQIAEKYGVRQSTVCRVLQHANAWFEHCVGAHAFLHECITPEGFDYYRFAVKADILTERQRELFYFLLTDCIRMGDVAAAVNRNPSTVWRANQRIVERFNSVSMRVVAPAGRKIDLREWKGKTEKEVCEMLGLPAGFYYRVVCAGERVGPYSRWAYEILRLRGLPPKAAARRLHTGEKTVLKYWGKYPGADLSGIPPPEPYTPAAPAYQAEQGSIKRALVQLAGGANTIGNHISKETYQKMMQLSGGGG